MCVHFRAFAAMETAITSSQRRRMCMWQAWQRWGPVQACGDADTSGHLCLWTVGWIAAWSIHAGVCSHTSIMHMLSGLIPLTRPNCSCCARTWTAATLPLVRHKFLAPWRAELRLSPVKLLLCKRVDSIGGLVLVWSNSDVVEEI